MSLNLLNLKPLDVGPDQAAPHLTSHSSADLADQQSLSSSSRVVKFAVLTPLHLVFDTS